MTERDRMRIALASGLCFRAVCSFAQGKPVSLSTLMAITTAAKMLEIDLSGVPPQPEKAKRGSK